MRLTMWALALGLLAAAVALWPDVPAEVPAYFGPDGRPDAWEPRSAGSWFALPAVALAIVAAVDVLTRWALARPDAPAFNLPGKEAILALPREKRAPVLARVGAMVHALGASCVIAFGLIQAGIWREAHGGFEAPLWVVAGGLAAVVLPLAVVVWGIVRVDAETRRQRTA